VNWLNKEEKRARQERFISLQGMLAFCFILLFDGWNRFCADLAIDPNGLLKSFPGFDTISLTEKLARLQAFSNQDAKNFLRQNVDSNAEPKSVEEVARNLHQSLERQADLWH
jgi:hypothetical protein